MLWFSQKVISIVATFFLTSFIVFALIWHISKRATLTLSQSGVDFSQELTQNNPFSPSHSLFKNFLIFWGIQTTDYLIYKNLIQDVPFKETIFVKNRPFSQRWLVVLKDNLNRYKIYKSPEFLINHSLPHYQNITHWTPIKNIQIYFDYKQKTIKGRKVSYDGLLQGNLGFSESYQKPILNLFKEYLPLTCLIGFFSAFISYGLCIPLAYLLILSPQRLSQKIYDIIIFLYSFPRMILGICLIWIFSWKLKWLPIQSLPFWEATSQPTTFFRSLILPCLTLSLPLLISNSLLIFKRLQKELSQDYILFALTKGLSLKEVLSRHLSKISLSPLIVRFKNSLLMIFSGSIITENLFGVSGLGSLSLKAILNNDISLMLAIAHLIILLKIVGQAISEGIFKIWYPTSQKNS